VGRDGCNVDLAVTEAWPLPRPGVAITFVTGKVSFKYVGGTPSCLDSHRQQAKNIDGRVRVRKSPQHLRGTKQLWCLHQVSM